MLPCFLASWQGVQSQKVIANIKHYILNNQETNRGSVSSNVDERTLHEVYMAPFRAGILAGAAARVVEGGEEARPRQHRRAQPQLVLVLLPHVPKGEARPPQHQRRQWMQW